MDTPMKIVKRIASVILILACSVIADAATEVGGLLQNTSIWTADKSPYLITDDFIVKENVTLTIEPGCEIQVNTGVTFLVNGKLIIGGTASSPVVISGQSGYNFEGAWIGIEVSGTSAGSVSATFTQIKFAESGFTVNSSSGNSASNCIFESNTYGISGKGFIEIFDSKFLKNYAGVNIQNKKISNCFFSNNTTGISNLSEGINIVENSEITFNKTGIFNASKNIEIRNTVISRNQTGFETVSTGKDSNALTGNSFCFNTIWGVKINGGNDLYLNDNCWCTENPVEVNRMIYDKGEQDNLGKALINSVYNCGDLSHLNIFSFTGQVFTGDSLLQKGVVLLYSSKYSPPVSWTTVNNGKYTFWSDGPNIYYTYAIPDPDVYSQYLPTFQGNTIDWEEAYSMYYQSDINVPDISLEKITTSYSGIWLYKGRISYISSSDVGTAYQEPWFNGKTDQSDLANPAFKVPVFVHDLQGKIILWMLTDSLGYFQFVGTPGNYISVQRPGNYLSPLNGRVNSQSLTNFYLNGGMTTGNASSPDVKSHSFIESILATSDFGEITNVEVFNSLGEIVFTCSGREFSQTGFPDNFSSGIYIFRIFNSNGAEIVRFVKP